MSEDRFLDKYFDNLIHPGHPQCPYCPWCPSSEFTPGLRSGQGGPLAQVGQTHQTVINWNANRHSHWNQWMIQSVQILWDFRETREIGKLKRDSLSGHCPGGLMAQFTDLIINNRPNINPPSPGPVHPCPNGFLFWSWVAWELAEPCKSVMGSINFWQVYIYKSQLWFLTRIKHNPQIIPNIICYEPHQLQLYLSSWL